MTKIKLKSFLIIFVFVIAPVIMGNDIKSNIMGKKWHLPKEFSACIVFSEKTYDILFAIGGYYCRGDYDISGNEVILFYPELMQPLFPAGSAVLEWIFQSNNKAAFFYDSEYIDFDCISGLRSNDRMLRNLSNTSPYGQMYKLQGVEVIKYNEQESMVLILDNLRMREYPDINSQILTLQIYMPSVNEVFSSHVVHKNSINNYDAKTVKQDTIDGITAPWYRIVIILNEVFHENVWVFGGYLREIDIKEITNKETMQNYWKRYYDTLIELEIIKRNPIW